MPSTLEAMHAFIASGIAYGPAKAANAGGVSVSQLEMAQNASMQRWRFERVDYQPGTSCTTFISMPQKQPPNSVTRATL